MSDTSLGVEIRDQAGKGFARKLRAAGRIPGVCYARNTASAPITLDPHALERLISASEAGLNTLIDLQVRGGGEYHGRKMLIKELQRDPVTGTLLHADLYAVDLAQVIQVSVPIHVSGSALGVRMSGGILDQSLRELEIKCLPEAIPKEILIDVTDLDIGDSLHVRDLVLPERLELVSDLDLSVVSVMAPAVEEEVKPAEEVLVEGEAGAAAGEAGAPAAASEEDSSGD